MVKKPDFSELTKKFDLNSIVGGIKSLLNPEEESPNVDPNDAIGVKIAQLSLMAQQLSKMLEQQSKDFVIMNQLLNDLYKDLEALRSAAKTESANKSGTVDETADVKDKTSPPDENL